MCRRSPRTRSSRRWIPISTRSCTVRTERPFSITLSFAPFKGDDYERAVALAEASAEYRTVGSGDNLRHRARFYPGDVTALHELFGIVGRTTGCEILIDDRPVPFARELWLPLLWFLLPRGPLRA